MTRRVGVWAGAKNRRRWTLIGMLAVLLVIGHDVLMTGDAHAALAPGHRHASGMPAADTGADADAGSRTDVTSSLGECGTAPSAAFRRPDPNLEATGTACSSEPAPALATVPVASTGGAHPGLPPRTRRALLQVYRI